jgi:hypothetical protein
MSDNPLANLSPEQLSALLDKLRQQTQAKPCVVAQRCQQFVQQTPAQSYYKVMNGYFVTVLDPRDVSDVSPEAIKKAACEPLQPWYMSDEWSDSFGYTMITRNEYIDWLRR